MDLEAEMPLKAMIDCFCSLGPSPKCFFGMWLTPMGTSDLGACHSAITRLYYSKWIWSRLSRFGDRWMKDEWFSPAQASEKTYIKSGI